MNNNNGGRLGYDLETNGLEKKYNTIVQVAFREYDENLEPKGDGDVLYGKVGMNYASPMATAIHGISPKELQKDGLSELELANKIHETLDSREGTLFGFNNNNFDDNVIRHNLFANGKPPYVIPNSGDGDSEDIYKLAISAHVLKSDSLEITKTEKGNPVLKLEVLSKVNDIEHENAHNALSDVSSSALLAKQIKENDPELFERWEAASNRQTLADEFKEEAPMLRIGRTQFGTVYSHPILPITEDPDSSNRLLAVRLDKPKEIEKMLNRLSPDEVVGVMSAEQEKLPAGFKSKNGGSFPFVAVKINGGDQLYPISDELDTARSLIPVADSKTEQFMHDLLSNPDTPTLTPKKIDTKEAQMFSQFYKDETEQAGLPSTLNAEKVDQSLSILKDNDNIKEYITNAYSNKKEFEPEENYRDKLFDTTLSASDHQIRDRLASIPEVGGAPAIEKIDVFSAAQKMSQDHQTHIELFTGMKFDSMLSRNPDIKADTVIDTLTEYLDKSDSLSSKYEVLAYAEILEKRLENFTDEKTGDPISMLEKSSSELEQAKTHKPAFFQLNTQSVMDAVEHNKQLDKTLDSVKELKTELEAEVPAPLSEFMDKTVENASVRTVRYGKDDYREINLAAG